MTFWRALALLLVLSMPALAQTPPEAQQIPIVTPTPVQNPLEPYRPDPATNLPQAQPVTPDVSSYPQPAPQIAPQPQAQPQAQTPPPQPTTPRISFDDWMNELRQDAIGQGVRAQTVYYALENAYPDDAIIEKDHTQPETKMTAQQYWDKLLDDSRVEKGRQFYSANHDLLRRVSEAYFVRSPYIAALLGIESNYGSQQGKENIINSLVTLSYEGRRADFFREELMSALHILDEGHVRLEDMRGSWAGAMGMCQFMPSSFQKYAQDFDNDGRINIWTSIPDAAASAANYLHQNGWKLSEGWGQEVQVTKPIAPEDVGTKIRKSFTEWRKLGVKKKNGKNLAKSSAVASLIQPDGPEGRSFLVTNNFYVLMSWNRSTYFAIAVGMLAEAITHR